MKNLALGELMIKNLLAKALLLAGILAHTPLVARLIEIGPAQPNLFIKEDAAGKIIEGKEYLETDIEEPVLVSSFEELIQEKHALGLPYILAVVTTEHKETIPMHAYYDAITLTNYLFTVKLVPAPGRIMNTKFAANGPFRDPATRQPIQQIDYLVLDKPTDTAFKLLGTHQDLARRVDFMATFFKANTNDIAAQVKILTDHIILLKQKRDSQESALEQLQIAKKAAKSQNKIIQEIESRLSVADKMEESITQSLQQAEALRQSILKKAFEGKLI